MMNRIALFLMICFLASCVDHTFDEPPGFEPEVVEANAMIEDVLDRWVPGQFVEITDDVTFSGYVIANDETGNFYKQLTLEDETGGIQLQLDAIGLFNEFPIGREVFVKAKGLYISDFGGVPQLTAGENQSGQSVRIAEVLIPEYLFNTNTTIAPNASVIEIDEITEQDLNTLVTLEDIQFNVAALSKPFADTENGFSLNHEIENCNGETLIVRTSSFASFADAFVPSEKGSITGVVGVFRDEFQLFIRDLDDLDFNESRCDGSEPDTTDSSGEVVDNVNQDFQSLNDNQDVSLTGWTNIAVKGTRLWRAKEFNGNVYAQATAFNDNSDEMETWLITPKIKFEGSMTMTFRSAVAFHTHDGFSLYYSSDFDGSNVEEATWTELSAELAGQGQANYAWVDSGEIDLSSISGEAYIGFKYVGNPNTGTTSFILDDVKILNQ